MEMKRICHVIWKCLPIWGDGHDGQTEFIQLSFDYTVSIIAANRSNACWDNNNIKKFILENRFPAGSVRNIKWVQITLPPLIKCLAENRWSTVTGSLLIVRHEAACGSHILRSNNIYNFFVKSILSVYVRVKNRKIERLNNCSESSCRQCEMQMNSIHIKIFLDI